MIILRNSDGGEGGQTATGGQVDILEGTGGEAGQNGEGQQQGGEGNEGQQQPSTGITEEALTRILQEVIPAARASAAPVQSQQEAPQLTVEQYEQLFNVWKPSTDLNARLRSDDPTVANKAIIEMRDGLIKQASTIAEARIQSLLKEQGDRFAGQLTPLQAFYQEQQNRALETEFFEAHKDLEPYAEIVDAVTAKIFSDGKQHTKAEAFKMAADASRSVVKKMLGAAGAGAANSANNGSQSLTNGAGARRMANLSGGGQTGSRAGGSAPARKAGMNVFDEAE
jgi:hypothetical protein